MTAQPFGPDAERRVHPEVAQSQFFSLNNILLHLFNIVQ
jgi:hypothetical protein